jgi:signal peptidase II
MKSNIKLFFLFFVLVVIDQFIKAFVGLPSLAVVTKQSPLASFFQSFVSYHCNQNIAWSVPIAPVIFYFAWIIIVSTLIYIFFKSKNFIQQFLLILIFSGAISNIIDRIRLGCVIDYVDLKFWPVFNLADVYITVGVIFIIFNFSRFFHLSSRA